ncbi:MAG: hypothetical protein AAF318_19850, partial [Pseudomonadota bacterium]
MSDDPNGNAPKKGIPADPTLPGMDVETLGADPPVARPPADGVSRIPGDANEANPLGDFDTVGLQDVVRVEPPSAAAGTVRPVTPEPPRATEAPKAPPEPAPEPPTVAELMPETETTVDRTPAAQPDGSEARVVAAAAPAPP